MILYPINICNVIKTELLSLLHSEPPPLSNRSPPPPFLSNAVLAFQPLDCSFRRVAVASSSLFSLSIPTAGFLTPPLIPLPLTWTKTIESSCSSMTPVSLCTEDLHLPLSNQWLGCPSQNPGSHPQLLPVPQISYPVHHRSWVNCPMDSSSWVSLCLTNPTVAETTVWPPKICALPLDCGIVTGKELPRQKLSGFRKRAYD